MNKLSTIKENVNEWRIACGGGADSFAMILHAIELLKDKQVSIPKAIRLIHTDYSQVTAKHEMLATLHQAYILESFIMINDFDIIVYVHSVPIANNVKMDELPKDDFTEDVSVYLGGRRESYAIGYRNLAILSNLLLMKNLVYAKHITCHASEESPNVYVIKEVPTLAVTYKIESNVWLGVGYKADETVTAIDAKPDYYTELLSIMPNLPCYLPFYNKVRSEVLQELIEVRDEYKLLNVIEPCFLAHKTYVVCDECNSCLSLKRDHPKMYNVLKQTPHR